MQRRRRISGRKNKQKGIWGKFLLVFIPLLVILLVLLFRSKYWVRGEKFTVVKNGADGNITIMVLDTSENTWTEVAIPGSVQVQVAGELGSWKLGSVWQLGVNEGLAGILLSRSVVKNFGIPVVIWQDVASGKTNMSLGDRLRMLIFNLQIGKDAVNTLDLTQTAFLKKTKFLDGSTGYVIAGELPGPVAALFVESDLPVGVKARIIDFSGSGRLAERLGQVVETMGVKVAAIQRMDPSDFDCSLTGTNSRLVRKLNLIFGCSDKSREGAENFDVSLEIGSRFIRRF